MFRNNNIQPLETSKSDNQKNQDVKSKGFAGVAGMKELKDLLFRDVINPLTNPDKYKKFKVSIPNGILLYGPPGCGKTYIVERLAEELGYHFMKVPVSKIGSSYILQTSINISNVFNDAEKKAPAILFFDEFEGLVPKRESLGRGGQSKNEEINEFLQQVNNASQKRILIVGATNQIDLIDDAVLRSGRIDRKIFVPPPDQEARSDLLKLNLIERPHSENIDFNKLAEKTENYLASDITLIVDNAARKAVENECEVINEQLLLEMVESTPPSLTKSQIEKYKERGKIEQNKVIDSYYS
jgi:transitional endoplasmic reticulum ATPase